MIKSAIKSIHWKLAFKYEIATALFYLEKDITLYPKGISQVFEGCGRWNCPGSAAWPPSFCLPHIVWYFNTGHDRGYRTLPLTNSIVTLQAPHPVWLPSFWPHPFCPFLPLATALFAPTPKMRPWLRHWYHQSSLEIETFLRSCCKRLFVDREYRFIEQVIIDLL